MKAGDPIHRVGFRYDGLHFEVTSPSEAHLRWLESFLVPPFLPGDGSPGNIEITVVIDDALLRERQEDLRGADPVPSFMFDARVASLPCREGAGGSRQLFHRAFRTVYEVSEDRRKVTLVAGEDGEELRLPLLRIIREYAMNEARNGGDIFLHASCFVFEGRPVILAGPTAAGKTTLLVHACLHGGAEILSNDRVRVGFGEKAFRVSGMPLPLFLRRGTLDFFSEIRRKVTEGAPDYLLLPEEHTGEDRVLLKPHSRGRLGLSPEQFCELTGAVRAAWAHYPILVFPRLTGRPGAFSLRRLSPGEAFKLLQDSLFGARHWAETTPVFNARGVGDVPAGGALEEQGRAFITDTPGLLCEVGLDFYERPEDAGTWIRSLLHGAGNS